MVVGGRRLPGGVPGPARHSIAGALAAAHGHAGLVQAARQAFTASMSATFTISAIGVLAAAVVAYLVMRETKAPVAPIRTPELVG